MNLGKRKIVFYSHDSFGLGHLRRTITISNYISKKIPNLLLFIITGSEMVQFFKIRKNIKCIKLPAVVKVDKDEYSAKNLNLTFDKIKNIRERIIFKIIIEIRPDIFIVDNVPLGLKGEILKTLEFLRKYCPQTKIILSMRDILDDANAIISNWNQNEVCQVLKKYYDQIWIYGCSKIYNIISNYKLPSSVANKVKFCGYIFRDYGEKSTQVIRKELDLNGERFILVTVGGGGDGYDLTHSYLESLIASKQNIKIKSLIIFGPDMPKHKKEELLIKYQGKSNLLFWEFHNDILSYMNAADLIVSMAGYNTICEILSLNKKAIVVPRIYPRIEQLIRARLMEKLGLLHMIYPTNLNQTNLITKVNSILELTEMKSALKEINFDGLPIVVNHIKNIFSNKTLSLN